MTVDEAIAATLAEWHAKPFGWADANCAFSVGRYVERLTGRDPSAFWHPLCGGEADAHRLIEVAGGHAGLIRQGMASIGATAVAQPARGDVVTARIRETVVPGIWLDPFAAFRSPFGVFRSRRFELLEAFRCA